MKITIVKSGPAEQQHGKRPYKKLPVLYTDESGAQKTKFIVSFSNPAVFKTLVAAQPGEVYEVKTQQNDRGYDDWVRVTLLDEEGDTDVPDEKRGVPERAPLKITITEADRQRSIVRQTCIKSAVEFLKDRENEDGGKPFLADVALTAQFFEDYINRAPDARVTLQKKEEKPAAPARKAVAKRRVLKQEPEDPVDVEDDDDEEIE